MIDFRHPRTRAQRAARLFVDGLAVAAMIFCAAVMLFCLFTPV